MICKTMPPLLVLLALPLAAPTADPGTDGHHVPMVGLVVPQYESGNDACPAGFSSAAEGQPCDLAPFAYTYRKGAADNPAETQWLNPKADMLCGLLWEERRAVRRIEVEFPRGTLARPRTAPSTHELRLITRGAFAPFEEPSAPGYGLGAQPEFTLKPAGDPATTSQGATVFTFVSKNDINSVKVLYSGNDPKISVPTVRAFGRSVWKKPLTVKIQWAFQPDRVAQRWDGRVEAYNGYIGRIESLSGDCGVTAVGEHAWKDKLVVPPSGGTNRLKPGLQTSAPAASNCRLSRPRAKSTAARWSPSTPPPATFSFAPRDLRVPSSLGGGPILIPSLGLFICTAESAVTPAQFQAQLAGWRLRTVRQQVRTEPEESWASAMKRFHGDRTPPASLPSRSGEPSPAFPKPPDPEGAPPPMQIDVPEPQLAAQWRLGAWHLKRWSEKQPDGSYCVSIWPPQPMGYTAIGLESSTIIRAMDVMGVADVAQGGLNYWLFTVKHTTPWGRYFDLGDGPLTAPGHNLSEKHRNSHYDQHHSGGHGRVLETCAMHYLLTRDDAWMGKAEPVLAKACRWTLQQRELYKQRLSPDCWCYGMEPPGDICDCADVRLSFSVNAWHYAGVRRAAEALAAWNPGKYAALLEEVESFRRDLRKAVDRSMALSPVVRVADGTYRRSVSFEPYLRGLGSDLDTGYSGDPASGCATGRWFEAIMGALLLVRSGIYDVREPVVQELLDVYEDRLVQDGQNHQNGYNDAPALHLMLDDVPLFLRGMYNSYASEVDPKLGYIFWEMQTGQYARDKTFEEAAFLERVRAMLVMEDGQDLWLARATPRTWLEQGKRIAVKNAPTCFGTVAYEIVSDVEHGTISATVEMPRRIAPRTVRLRFRHPKAAPIKSVTVNGKLWLRIRQSQGSDRHRGCGPKRNHGCSGVLTRELGS